MKNNKKYSETDAHEKMMQKRTALLNILKSDFSLPSKIKASPIFNSFALNSSYLSRLSILLFLSICLPYLRELISC
mgnify:CR=1 FL=1